MNNKSIAIIVIISFILGVGLGRCGQSYTKKTDDKSDLTKQSAKVAAEDKNIKHVIVTKVYAPGKCGEAPVLASETDDSLVSEDKKASDSTASSELKTEHHEVIIKNPSSLELGIDFFKIQDPLTALTNPTLSLDFCSGGGWCAKGGMAPVQKDFMFGVGYRFNLP